MRNFEAKVVKEAAIGHWDRILKNLAPEISEKAFIKVGRHVPCPVHGAGQKGGDGFKFFRKDFHEVGGAMCNSCGTFSDGFKVLMWLKGWDFPDTVAAVADALGIRSTEDQGQQRAVNKAREAEIEEIRQERLRQRAKDDVRIRARLQKIWRETLSLTSPEAEPARLYCASRKLYAWDKPELKNMVRFHKGLASYNEDGEYEGHFPAIVLLVKDKNGVGVTLHRHYLTERGEKAPIENSKKMCEIPSDRDIVGGCIRLSEPSEELDVAEGLETAWAVESAMRVPVWTAINATLLEMFEPPEGVKLVRVWADKDVSGTGEKAARALQKRLWEKGIRVQIKMPPLPIPDGAKGVDWNDVWVQLGRFGFQAGGQDKRAA